MADKGTCELFLEIARKEVGTVEGPKDNETKYGAFTKANFLPWCGSFVMWIANQAGVKIPNTVSTVNGAKGFQKLNRWEDVDDATPRPGDIVYFDFVPGGAPIEHVGIVLKDNGDGTLTCIEGNTSSDKRPKGSQANGGECCLKIRAWKKKNARNLSRFIVGFGRPVFKDAPDYVAPSPKSVPTFPGTIKPGDKGEAVKAMQLAMDMDADGIYGPVTKKAVIEYQSSHPGLEANGIVGPKTWEAIHTD